MNRKRNIIEWTMHYRQIVILAVCCLIAFGIYSLPNMRKNEFPDFTIRQGMIVAVAPGNTAEEMIEQVTKPLENYIFSYKEVKKEKTFSKNRDGITYIQVELNDELNNKDEFWSKFKHGIETFKNQLPSNVLAVEVIDDFGDTSSLLVTMESDDKTYRELNDYMDELQDKLRCINSIGRMTVSGLQKEQISIYLDNNKLTQYGLNEQTLAATLFQKGFVTTGGKIKNTTYVQPIYVAQSLNSVRDVQEQIVYTDPKGNNIRLKDIAQVVKEYPKADSYITNNGKKCLLLSIEMKKGQNIVKMGEDINVILNDFQKTLPSEVNIYRITDQSKVVDDSVTNFLHELLIAIIAVIIVVMLLLPLRVALVAASTIPITIFISLGLFNAFGLELNTVTLAALIVTLGMIVDNSIVIIDNYLYKLGEGQSRWDASIESTTHFLKSIISATLAISITFFPFLFIMKGMMKDFVQSFPWAIILILGISLLVAIMLVPFMQFYFIRKPINSSKTDNRHKKISFLDYIQKQYNKLLDLCFKWPRTTLLIGVCSVIAGILLMKNLPQQLMPTADRNQFAVEIYLPTGSAIEKTTAIADSLEHILKNDNRITSITSFHGCASPRFHTAYAPQTGGTNYAQFIVNTKDTHSTEELLDEYSSKYANYFPDAFVRFKQLSYSQAIYPIEIRISGTDLDTLKSEANKILSLMRNTSGVTYASTDLNEPQASIKIQIKEDEASRLGVSNLGIETTLAMRYGEGLPIANVWEDDYDVKVVLKGDNADNANNTDLENENIPVAGGLSYVPLRQIADIIPIWKDGQLVRRNGIYTITVQCELERHLNAMEITNEIKEKIENLHISPNVNITYGGELEESEENLPTIMSGLVIASLIIFFILLMHFHKINISLLIFASMSLCLFGAATGVIIHGLSFSVTCVLGLVSLMGIIVRNGIIMIDYAEELRMKEKLHVREAIYLSAQRRMRPIFLTSAAASMGVIPMILGKSGLWMPMGTVICYGTLITMVFLLTVLPVSYWLIFRGSTQQRNKVKQLEME